MSTWAKIDENNIVTEVVRADNNDPNGDEGHQWLLDNHGGNWIQTSFLGAIRKNYAGVGYTYDFDRDAFIPPKRNCHLEETLDELTCQWICSNPQHELDRLAAMVDD